MVLENFRDHTHFRFHALFNRFWGISLASNQALPVCAIILSREIFYSEEGRAWYEDRTSCYTCQLICFWSRFMLRWATEAVNLVLQPGRKAPFSLSSVIIIVSTSTLYMVQPKGGIHGSLRSPSTFATVISTRLLMWGSSNPGKLWGGGEPAEFTVGPFLWDYSTLWNNYVVIKSQL